jgi:hypothetical protein
VEEVEVEVEVLLMVKVRVVELEDIELLVMDLLHYKDHNQN